MVTIQEIQTFIALYSEYIKTFKKAIHHEKANSKNPNYLGWQWYDVETLGAKLQRLVARGFIKVSFRPSKGATYYRLLHREEIADALKTFLSPTEYRKLRAKPW